MAVSDILKRAKAVEAAFRVLPGIYLIGSLERGVTVYSQQRFGSRRRMAEGRSVGLRSLAGALPA